MRPRGVRGLAQGHTAGEWQSRNFSQIGRIPNSALFPARGAVAALFSASPQT